MANPAEALLDWASSQSENSAFFHASAVAMQGRAALILGRSGSGKSSLALALMAHGAALIADDLALVTATDGQLMVAAGPDPILAIEARGIGLISAGTAAGPTPLVLVVDMDRTEPQRLPPRRQVAMAGQTAPLIYGGNHPTLAPAVALLLKTGFAEIDP